MTQFAAFALLGAFALYQLVPLALAFRGRAQAWLLSQLGFAVAMLVLAELQVSGRSAWVLLAATGAALVASSIVSLLLALIGGYLRRAKAPAIEKGIA